jgi:TPR repeat protein
MSSEEKERLRQQGEQIKAGEEAAWKDASPKQQRAHMMALLAPFLEQMAKACETGKTNNCATVGQSKYRSQDLAGARRYYGLGCQQGDKASCYDLIQMEAVSGLPSQARQLFATYCATSTISTTPPAKGNRCPTLHVILQALPLPQGIGRLPLPGMLKERLSMETNLLQLALPKHRQESFPKVFQAAVPAPQAGAAGQSYAEGIRLAFGIDRAVDLTKAESQLQKAADQGMNVGERLLVLVRELSEMSGPLIDPDSAIIHFKLRWVAQKACDFGRPDVCQFLAVTEQQERSL